MTDYSNIPDYDSLPPVKGMPKGCAWGIFDKDGKKDKFGTLNLITPEIVKEAVKEVKEGVSVSLKYASTTPSGRSTCNMWVGLTVLASSWPIGAMNIPGFGRKGLVHKVFNWMDTPHKVHGFDDEVSTLNDHLARADR